MSRILIVEDNADLAFGLQRTLEFEGYEVQVASDGMTGLSMARSEDFDLILLDLMLPKIDGFRVLREIRRDGSRVPVLLLTAKGDEAVAEIFADIGSDRLTAARKMLGYLQDNTSAQPIADAARRLVFLKGTNSHDYKFSSAVLEDYEQLAQPWRDRLLAASVFYFRGSGEKDNALVGRIRTALGA